MLPFVCHLSCFEGTSKSFLDKIAFRARAEREEEKERVFLESLLNWPAGQMFVGWGPFSARAIDKSFQRR